MQNGKTILLKVGGSLLLLADLRERLKRLCEALRPARLLIVPGGGATADLVRSWDRLHGLDTIVSHELALETLGLNARLLAGVMPKARLIATRDEGMCDERILILDVPPLLEELHRHGATPLPAGWHVTSDSVAGWLALHWAVDELVLVKSTGIPDALPVGETGRIDRGEVVDAWFAQLIPQLPPLFWCNLRDDPARLFAFERSHDGSGLVPREASVDP